MSDREPKFYHTTRPNPSQITADEEDSRLVWKYQRDEYGHCLEADFYFTRVFVVLIDAYTAQLKRIYIFHLHVDGDAFIGTGDTLRDAYRDAGKVYRTEMSRRDEKARQINHIEMWGSQQPWFK